MRHGIMTILMLYMAMTAQAGELRELPREAIGAIGFYVDTDTRKLHVEMPIETRVSLSRIDGLRFVSVEMKMATNLERPEFESLRRKYPGYSLESFDVFARWVELDIRWPQGLTMEPSLPSSGQVEAVAVAEVSAARYEEIRHFLQAGGLPEVRARLRRRVPVRDLVEHLKIPLGEACLRTADSFRDRREVRAGEAAGRLALELRDSLKDSREAEHSIQAFKTALSRCLRAEPPPRWKGFSDLTELKVGFNALPATEILEFRKERSAETTVISDARLEIRWREDGR